MKRKLWFTTAAAATVAAAGLVFFSLTPEGTALADRVVKFFAPQKQLDTQIEGGTETPQITLFINKDERLARLQSAMAQLNPSELPSATAELKPTKLTWDNLMIFGAKLDTNGFEAINALTDAIGSQPVRDDTGISGGGKTRTVAWADGTIAVLRNADLYSIETTNSNASVVGLHPGMTLDQFKAVLGEPHEGINGTLAWGVGSNDNLIITLADGAVTSIKISLVE